MAKKMKADGTEATDVTESSSGATPMGTDAAGIASGLVDSAKQSASQAKETVTQMFGQAKEQATSRVDEQRQNVASGFQSVAHAFQSMGDELRKREEGPVADYAAELGQAIGGQVERLATYLKERDVRQLVADTEDFARRSPAVFLGSAFVLGLAASRFLKSSRAAAAPPSTPAPPQLLLPAAATPGGTEQPASAEKAATTTPFWAAEGETGSQAASVGGTAPTPFGTKPVGA